jgi:hypothetical protein
MKGFKTLLIGCGQLGSRHLQAIASLPGIGEVHVVDLNEDRLELGKIRINEIGGVNPEISFHWAQQLDEKLSGGDLCIVATQAFGRCDLVKQVSDTLGYKNFLIEKIVSQSLNEYRDLMDFVKQRNLSVWVNCQLRTFGIYKYIKGRLDPSEPIVFCRVGGNQGLANNGVHTADLFLFYDGSDQIEIVGDRIDPEVHKSKRGSDVYDLSGSLFGCTEKGSDFILSFARESHSPAHISILGPRAKFIVSHRQNWALESYADADWEWQQVHVSCQPYLNASLPISLFLILYFPIFVDY